MKPTYEFVGGKFWFDFAFGNSQRVSSKHKDLSLICYLSLRVKRVPVCSIKAKEDFKTKYIKPLIHTWDETSFGFRITRLITAKTEKFFLWLREREKRPKSLLCFSSRPFFLDKAVTHANEKKKANVLEWQRVLAFFRFLSFKAMKATWDILQRNLVKRSRLEYAPSRL